MSGPFGELVKCRSTGPVKWYGLKTNKQTNKQKTTKKQTPGERYLKICILMSFPASSPAHGYIGLSMLRALVWISAFQCFLPQVIEEICSHSVPTHTHVSVKETEISSNSTVDVGCTLNFLSCFLFFSRADFNSLSRFYDSPVGHNVWLVTNLVWGNPGYMCSPETWQILQSFAIIVIVWNCKPGLHLFPMCLLILLLTRFIFTCVLYAQL